MNAPSHRDIDPAGEDLSVRLRQVLEARAALAPDAGAVRRRVDATTSRRRRRRRATGIGVLAGGLVVTGTAVAGAATDAPWWQRWEREVLDRTGASSIEHDGVGGYTREQYYAFWGAGYTYDDVLKLNQLWKTSDVQTKSRAGQMILDHRPLPLPPSGTPSPGADPSPSTDPGTVAVP